MMTKKKKKQKRKKEEEKGRIRNAQIISIWIIMP